MPNDDVEVLYDPNAPAMAAGTSVQPPSTQAPQKKGGRRDEPHVIQQKQALGEEGYAEQAPGRHEGMYRTIGLESLPVTIALGGPEAFTAKGLVSMGRGMLKSLGGSIIGGGLGYAGGRLISPKAAQTGEKIGATVGGLSGPFMGNRIWAGAPYGLNRFLLSNEDIAAERSAMKLAQRAADINAGLRQPPSSPLSQTFDISPAERGLAPGQEPLVLTPGESSAADQLQAIAEQQARKRGMQYAGGVRTAGPNRPANRLFPILRKTE